MLPLYHHGENAVYTGSVAVARSSYSCFSYLLLRATVRKFPRRQQI